MSVTPATLTRRERRQAARRARHQVPTPRSTRRRPGLATLSALGLVGGLLVVALAIALGSRPAVPPSASAPVAIARVPAALVTHGFAIGRSDAPVTIDLYEDFQCPACRSWASGVFPRLAQNELANGTVRIVFHDMAFLGPESTDAGLAAFAAAQQDRFWDMWATIYANQGHENSGAFSRERLVAMARGLGLDLPRFEADLSSSAARAALDRSRSEAAGAGVTSTPTVIVERQVLVGAQPYAELAALIASVDAR